MWPQHTPLVPAMRPSVSCVQDMSSHSSLAVMLSRSGMADDKRWAGGRESASSSDPLETEPLHAPPDGGSGGLVVLHNCNYLIIDTCNYLIIANCNYLIFNYYNYFIYNYYN